MAGISPTIGSAQHPMIRRRLRLAEVRMSALDGLTLLPFPRRQLSQGVHCGYRAWHLALLDVSFQTSISFFFSSKFLR